MQLPHPLDAALGDAIGRFAGGQLLLARQLEDLEQRLKDFTGLALRAVGGPVPSSWVASWLLAAPAMMSHSSWGIVSELTMAPNAQGAKISASTP
jgi:hypothetical protein